MKTVYFVQHGIAHSTEIDPSRPLTDLGKEQVRRVATYLKDHNIKIAKIFHSGKLRAQQTALLFSEILAVDNVAAIKGMEPTDSATKLVAQLTEDAVMYVGHLPNLCNTVGLLISGNNKQVLKFKNAAVACIEIDIEAASLQWFITPEMC
ncbi:MAG: phosphohistidine phosphatase SixA [Psychromonas sp.]